MFFFQTYSSILGAVNLCLACLPPQVLANFACDEVFLTETPSWMFLEEDTRVHQAFQKFRVRRIS